MDTKILDYHDILLRKGDVELLKGSGWLNDQARAALYSCLWILEAQQADKT